MTDPNADNAATPPDAKGFPFVTVAATLGVLFVFLGLVILAYRSPGVLDVPPPDGADAKGAPGAETRPALDELKARNEAALNGVGAKMSRDEAHGRLLATLKGSKDALPFPTPEQVVPAAAPKKDDKKDGKE